MIHMKTSVSRRLIYIKYIYIFIKIKIIAFFIISLFNQLYVSVGILLTCRKYLHDRIILQRREVRAVMYLCVRCIKFASFYDYSIIFRNCSDSVVFLIFPFISKIFLLYLGIVLTVWYFVFFFLFLRLFYYI